MVKVCFVRQGDDIWHGFLPAPSVSFNTCLTAGVGVGGLLSAFFILERKTPPNMLKYQGKHEASLVIILNVGSAFGL